MSNPYETLRKDAPRLAADPVLRSAWREALVVFALWAAAMAWSVGYCAFFAYPGEGNLAQAARDLKFVLGFPAWVFWGIVLPWVLCAALSYVISRYLVTDEDLGVDPDEAIQEIIDG